MFPSYTTYPQGFLLLPKKLAAKDIPNYWLSRPFGEYIVYHDPRVAAVHTGETLFLGHAVHIPTKSFSPFVLTELLDEFRESSTFDTEVDQLCGRFVVITKRDGGLWVRQDACAMRQVFHTKVSGGTAVASHPRLAAVQAELKLSKYVSIKKKGLSAYPGRTTCFEDVWNLLPATELELHSGIVRRFYFGPREKESLSVEQAAKILIDNAAAQYSFLLSRPPLRVSMSAGLDSRTSLALIRPIAKEAELFNYRFDSKRQHEGDTSIPSDIAERFSLRLRVLAFDYKSVESDQAEVFKKNYPMHSHMRQLSVHYAEDVPFGLHLRSNIYEGTVSQIRRHGYKDVEEITPAVLASISSRRYSEHPLLIEAWDEYMQTTDFAKIRNIDPLTLFFFEHRMGSWIQAAYLEADVAHHNVHTLVNHRPTLEAMNAVTYDERVNEAVQLQAIKTAWPELLEFPINGKLRG